MLHVAAFSGAGPSCNLLIAPDLVVSLPVGGSSTSYLQPIPTNPAFLGAELYFHGAQLDLIDFSVTERGRALIGQ